MALEQIDYDALAKQAGAVASVPPPPAAPPRPAMTFALVNGQRVALDDTADPMAPGVITKIGQPGIVPPPAPPAPTPPPASAGPIDYDALAKQAGAVASKPPDPSLWERLNTSPFHDQFEAARTKSWQDITTPTADTPQDPISSAVRGMRAGTAQGGLSFLEQSFTTPIGAALWLTGLGPESAVIKSVPALKTLASAPAINALRVAVHGTAGAAFAAHGAGTMAGGASTIYNAATSPEAPPEGRWDKALGGLGEMGQGAIEAAGGVLGMHGAYTAAKPTIDAWQQTRRTAAGAAAVNDFRMAAPPSASAPYTPAQLERAYPELVRDHVTNAPITTVAEAIAAADAQIQRLETGFDKLIAVDPNQLIPTKPLDAVRAAIGGSVRSDALTKGLAKLETLNLDQPLTVERANAIRKQLNAENDAILAQNKYDVAVARQVDPAFAAREAAAASLREGVHDVLDARAQQTPGFTRDLRQDEGAVIAVRGALMRQRFQNEATVGRSGVTSSPRRILGTTVELGTAGAGGMIGGAVGGAAGGPAGAVPGAVVGTVLGKELGGKWSAKINRPPISRDALIERSFERAGAAAGTGLQTTPPAGGVPVVPGAAIVVPGAGGPGGPGGGGPGGPGAPPSGPGAPPGGGGAPTPAGSSTRATAVDTFLALRARGYSREQAVQMAASYARQLPPASGTAFTEGEIVPGPDGPTGGAPASASSAPGPRGLPSGPTAPRQLGPAPPPGPLAAWSEPDLQFAAAHGIPSRQADALAELKTRGIAPDTYAARLGAPAPAPEAPPVAAPYAARLADPATIAGDAAPPVADQPPAAARAGTVAPGGGPELPGTEAGGVQPAPERPASGQAGKAARAKLRAAERTRVRAEALAEEQQGLDGLVSQAQANGYTGDPAALRAELADRLQGIKELHAELDESGQHGLTLLKALAQNGGLSATAQLEDRGSAGEMTWLKGLQDTKASRSRTNLQAPPVVDSGRVRGVNGVFRDASERVQGGRRGGQSLDSMLERLQQDPRFYHITTTDQLSEAIHAAATGREESRNALKDLSATSHDLIGTATPHPEDDFSFDPAALEAESQAHAAAASAPPVAETKAEHLARMVAEAQAERDAAAARQAAPPVEAPVAPRGKSPTELRAEMDRRYAGVAAELADVGPDAIAVTLEDARGRKQTITKSARRPGMWQLTYYTEDGTASGHSDYPTLEQAYQSGRGLYGKDTYGPSAGSSDSRPIEIRDANGTKRAPRSSAPPVPDVPVVSDTPAPAPAAAPSSPPAAHAAIDALYVKLLDKGSPVGPNLYELPDAAVPVAFRKKVESRGRPAETAAFSLRPKADVTGDPYARGWILKDKRPDVAARTPPAPVADVRPPAAAPASAPPAPVEPTAPANLDEYLSQRKYNARLRATYYKDGEQIASSRTTPQTAPIPALGTWRIEDGPRALDGREIAQLRIVPIDQIEISEDTGAEKFGDVEQYARWIKEGKQPPPIEILQTDKGTLKTVDHRRLLAAKAAGQDTIAAWVSPSTVSDRPGAPSVGLTYELAQKGARPIAETPARPDYTIFKGDAPRLEALRAKLEAERAAPVADVPVVSDTLDTGEQQPRLTGTEGARQVGRAPVSLRAPVQATAENFTLEAPRTAAQIAADAAAESARAQGPSLFGEAPPEAPAQTSQTPETPPTPSGSSAPSAAPGVSAEDIPLELATRAHAGTSHVPDTRAAGERAAYVAHMTDVWTDLIGRATTPEQRAIAADEFANYRTSYLEKKRAELSQRSGMVSPMIAGPANFPAARMAKKSATYEKGVQAFQEWQDRAQRAMVRAVDPAAPGLAISADRPDAPSALQTKIDAAVKQQVTMTAANKIVKSSASPAEKIAALEALDGIGDALKATDRTSAATLLTPDFAGRLGFPDYALRNNRANITRMQGRIGDIGTERARPVGAATFDGGTIAEDADANRIQVTFDAKPDADTRATLKANGFKWSPSGQVWQRQRGPHAREAVRRIFGVTLDAPPEDKTGTHDE